MQTSLQGIAKKAQRQKQYRFRDLYGLLNEDLLKECWRDIRRDAAYGVDRVSAQDYEQHLDENIGDLVARLKQKRYRAKLVRRHYIPKGDGRVRPLGIPAVEDKLLQLAVARVLGAIYEQDFLPCSYGYRPHVGALHAVDDLTVTLQFGPYQYVVEADIESYFERLDHDWLLRMLAERIDDRALLGLIRKWLKAGILDTDGQVLHPATGTPQGGSLSPVLSNVYLHYALDLWFTKVVKPRCRGTACLFRYADDYVCGFADQADATRFYAALGPRLKKFGLALAAAKTRVVPFSRYQPLGQTCFEFLGFEFRWGRDRKGRAHLKRRTARAKLRASRKRFTAWCKTHRHLRLAELFARVNAKLRGYYQYYGVNGNMASLRQFFQTSIWSLFKWLNRRSQRRSYTWQGYKAVLAHFKMERPRIVGRPKTRKAPVLA